MPVPGICETVRAEVYEMGQSTAVFQLPGHPQIHAFKIIDVFEYRVRGDPVRLTGRRLAREA
jgi:hypothetical protein